MFDFNTDKVPLVRVLNHLKKKQAELKNTLLNLDTNLVDELNDLKNELQLIEEKLKPVKYALRLQKSRKRFKVLYVGYRYHQEVKRDLGSVTIEPIATIDDVLPTMIYKYMFKTQDLEISTIFDTPFDFVNEDLDAVSVANVFKRRLTLAEFIAYRKEVFEKAKKHFTSSEYNVEDLEHLNETFSVELEVFSEITEKEYDDTLNDLMLDLMLAENCRNCSLQSSTYFSN